MERDYAPPTKRSVLIAGHQNSISPQPMFWRALEAAAKARGVPIDALVRKSCGPARCVIAAEADVGDRAVAIDGGADSRANDAPSSGEWFSHSEGSISQAQCRERAGRLAARGRRGLNRPLRRCGERGFITATLRQGQALRLGAAKMRLDAIVASACALDDRMAEDAVEQDQRYSPSSMTERGKGWTIIGRPAASLGTGSPGPMLCIRRPRRRSAA